MPEGHTIHRAALDHHRIMAGQKLKICSPQGRFTEGASRLSGQLCNAVEAFRNTLFITLIVVTRYTFTSVSSDEYESKNCRCQNRAELFECVLLVTRMQ